MMKTRLTTDKQTDLSQFNTIENTAKTKKIVNKIR